MSANTSPLFDLTPVLATAQVSTANTGRDGTGTLGSVYTGDSFGTRIDRVVVTGTVTTTAGMVRLFIYDGTNTRLIKEIAVTAATPSGTVQAFTAEWVRTDGYALLILPATYVLKASTHNAETFNVTAYGGSF